MSIEENNEVGSAVVHINPKQVYKVVRNILANEYKLDPVEIRENARVKAEELIKSEVLDYIKNKDWTGYSLDNRINNAITNKVNDIKGFVKDIVKELVYKQIQEEIEGVIGVIIEKGIDIKIGWKSRKVKVSTVDNV